MGNVSQLIIPRGRIITEFKTINYKGAIVEVSREGVIRINGKIRNQFLNPDGYPRCNIKTDNGWTTVTTHRLVAIAFVPNPNNLNEVNHIDYNRANCHADNLEWITHADNVRYSICNRPDISGSNNPNYHNNTLHLRYLNNPAFALEKQSRKGLQNGRCRKIEMYYDGVLEKTFDYIEECCKYIQAKYCPNVKTDSIRGRINAVVREGGIYKQHLTFKKLD